MRFIFIAALFLGGVKCSLAQPNCNVFLWKGDSAQYLACKLLTEGNNNFYQFSKAYHQLLDSALRLCPYFAYAYREKAAPYVKSGNFIEWKKYIDLAVKYDSISYLPVRALLRYKFFSDYEGAIQDIDLLDEMLTTDIAYTSNGTYHLTVVKALCYKQTGRLPQAIITLENLLEDSNYVAGLYDYYHLGVMYFQNNQWEKSVIALTRQLQRYNFAGAQYYLAKCFQSSGKQEEYMLAKAAALQLWKEDKGMFDAYHCMIDQVFESDLHKI
jgi:tetratricopeptide (TPR) repeat protein